MRRDKKMSNKKNKKKKEFKWENSFYQPFFPSSCFFFFPTGLWPLPWELFLSSTLNCTLLLYWCRPLFWTICCSLHTPPHPIIYGQRCFIHYFVWAGIGVGSWFLLFLNWIFFTSICLGVVEVKQCIFMQKTNKYN